MTGGRSGALEWIPQFDDPMLAQSALDRLAHNAHQVFIEGESYRERLAPGAPPRKGKSATARNRSNRKSKKR